LTITQVLADIHLRPGPGPGPKKKFDRDRDRVRDQPEILTGTGTGTKNFLPGLDRDRDQKKVILQIPTSDFDYNLLLVAYNNRSDSIFDESRSVLL
jgi:hypothetical protein